MFKNVNQVSTLSDTVQFFLMSWRAELDMWVPAKQCLETNFTDVNWKSFTPNLQSSIKALEVDFYGYTAPPPTPAQVLFVLIGLVGFLVVISTMLLTSAQLFFSPNQESFLPGKPFIQFVYSSTRMIFLLRNIEEDLFYETNRFQHHLIAVGATKIRRRLCHSSRSDLSLILPRFNPS